MIEILATAIPMFVWVVALAKLPWQTFLPPRDKPQRGKWLIWWSVVVLTGVLRVVTAQPR